MKITFLHRDGSDTEVDCPSTALMHWYGHQTPFETPGDKVLAGGLVRIGPPMPAPYHRNFFSMVVAAIERKYNKTPDVESPEPNALKAVYEARCLAVLNWLNDMGDINNLVVDMRESHEDENEREEGV